MDYRQLNTITIKDRFPIPRIDDTIDFMAGSCIFTKMDLRCGFHQIRIHPPHVERTAFQTPFGSYQFLVMPFGLCNAPSTFQRTMNLVLEGLLHFCIAYIYDIVIFSKSMEEHAEHLRQVLTRLREHKLYVNKEKCEFALSSVEFCGFVIGENGVATQKDKTSAITSWPHPQNVKDIRSFLGLCGFYQRFIPRYATIVSPLTNLLRKDVEWNWGESERNAFQEQKHAMKYVVELAYPNMNKEFILHVDASDSAIGATLYSE